MSIRPTQAKWTGQVCQYSPSFRLACPYSWGWLEGLDQGWQMLSQIVTATSAAGYSITPSPKSLLNIFLLFQMSHFYIQVVSFEEEGWGTATKLEQVELKGGWGLPSDIFWQIFEQSLLTLVRWKAMKLDREEAEEEMYMPTDEVFDCQPFHNVHAHWLPTFSCHSHHQIY